ncbi:MAG: hypothetical protein V1770_02680 [bacterium]
MLLNFFFTNRKKSFYVRELVMLTNMQLNSIRRELENLVKFGILIEDKNYKAPDDGPRNFNLPIKRRYYKLNQDFVLYNEIKTLIIKSKLLLENKLIEKLGTMGQIKNLILTGIFTGAKNSPVDILIVGEIKNKDSLKNLVHEFGNFINTDLNYSVLTEDEYKYRWGIKDKFLCGILDSEKIEIKG